MFYRNAATYDFHSPNGIYHREYVPFIDLYFKVPWAGTDPGETTGTKYIYYLDGYTATNWNDDNRSGYMWASAGSWSGARDAVVATGFNPGDTSGNRVGCHENKGTFTVYRSFIAFDMAEIVEATGDITSAQLRLRSGSPGPTNSPKFDVFQGTWDYALTASGINDFTGSSLVAAPQVCPASGSYMTFTFNQDGLDYLNANQGKLVYFCIREYDHDVLNVPLTPADNYAGYFWSASTSKKQADYDPRLYVIHEKSNEFTMEP
jgi:hypothetical protein